MLKYIFAALVLIGLVIISLLFKKEKISKVTYKVLNGIFIVLFLEATIFNINSYRMDFGTYDTKVLNFSDSELTLGDGSEKIKESLYYFSGEGSGVFIFNDINTKITTMKFEIPTSDTYEINIYYTDEASKEFAHSFRKEVSNFYERSKYIPCYFSGESEKLLIEFVTNSYINIEESKIILNQEIPFEVSFTRIIILISIYLFFVACRYSKMLNSNGLNEYIKGKLLYIFLIMITFLIVVLWFSDKTNENVANVYTHNFVDAIINKSICLLDEPVEKLKELENPYDTTLRKEAGLVGTHRLKADNENQYLWDTAYYEGKYYVYFGILPALELLVPYKLIVGEYLLSGNVVLIYSIVFITAIVFLCIEILRKWFSDVPFKNWIYFIIFVLCGSMILWPNSRASFYEIPVASGLAHCAISALCIFNAFSGKKGKISYIKLFLGATFLALAVACRPTFLLVSLIPLPYLIMLFIKSVKEKRKKDVIKLILAIGIPYITVGILLMLYNYLRFGSIFEFGANYQLTINDIGKLEYRAMVIPLGIQNLLFKIPLIIEEFPFFFFNNRTLTFYGYYYTENLLCGYLFIAPLCFIIFGIKKILKKVEEKDLKSFLYISLTVAMLICVFSIYMAGSLQRYIIDYAWILIIVAACLMLQLHKNIKSNTSKNLYNKIIQAILLVSVVVTIFICGIIGENDFLRIYSSEDYYKIRYTICFWE